MFQKHSLEKLEKFVFFEAVYLTPFKSAIEKSFKERNINLSYLVVIAPKPVSLSCKFTITISAQPSKSSKNKTRFENSLL